MSTFEPRVQHMAWSTGTKSLMGEVLGWAAVAMAGAFALTHFDELKTVTAGALGLPPPGQTANAEEQAERPAATPAGGTVELKAGAGGHFHATAEVDGRDVEVLVDTGATMVALTYEDAERAGIYLDDSDFTHRTSTANGIARVAPVTLGKVSIGDITVRNVKAVVSERGKLSTTLLGMTFLSRLARVDMRAGVLVLED